MEERVRLHWPRKGRAEVQAMQPRVGELQSHRRRLARHERDMKIKMVSLSKDFELQIIETKKGMVFYHQQVEALLELLPTQSSLAALQGLLGKGKNCTSEFQEASEDYCHVLNALVHHTHELFENRNRSFREASILFDDGGDYAEKEVNTCINSINEIMFTFERQVQTHHLEIDSIRKEQKECLKKFDEYKLKYSEALIDLSMKEGLGKKFGAPRRHAQEHLRSEVNRSSSSEKEINHLIAVIKSIGTMQMPETHRDNLGKDRVRAPQLVLDFFFDCSGGNSADLSIEEKMLIKQKGVDVDVILLQCILCLRKKMLKRGRYLSALRDAIDIPIDEPMPVSPVFNDINVDTLYVNGSTDNLRGTFDDALALMETNCLKSTVVLYEEVGKLEQLGEDQCPERLRVWLKKTKEGAMLYEKEARTVYRHQIETLNHILATTPTNTSYISYTHKSLNVLDKQWNIIKKSFYNISH